MKEIQEHKIKIYEFPETDDEEENKIVKKIKVNHFLWKELWRGWGKWVKSVLSLMRSPPKCSEDNKSDVKLF